MALTSDEIRAALRDPDAVSPIALSILKNIASLIAAGETEIARELVIRCLNVEQAFAALTPLLNDLVRAVGLFPYLPSPPESDRDLIAYEFHRPPGMDDRDVVFHSAQAEVYRRLLAGDNVVLSAPTSFGKSLIIDAILASCRFQDVAVIVPTIALADETRRRLDTFYGSQYVVISQLGQKRGERNVYVMTQERYLALSPAPEPELLVLDEFYKLDPDRRDERFALLNEVLYRHLKRRGQLYLLGPNIKEIPSVAGLDFDLKFMHREFETVVSEVHFFDSKPDRVASLLEVLADAPSPAVVYCASPKNAMKVAGEITQQRPGQTHSELHEALDWIGAHYHEEWDFVHALRAGVGVHHGRLPRSLSQAVMRWFEDATLETVVCTSTIIEGVNTNAKSVIIYDSKVARRKLDFFTFSNIRGRAGRMFKHYVGQVYVFESPPEPELPNIDIPALTQSPSTPEGLLLQMDWNDLSSQSKQRLERIVGQDTVPIEILKEHRGIKPHLLIEFGQYLQTNAGEHLTALQWSGVPEWQSLEPFVHLLWTRFDFRRGNGIYSARQLAFKLSRLASERNIRTITVEDSSNSEYPRSPSEAISDYLDFTRSWAQFYMPRYIRAADAVQKHILPQLSLSPGDWLFYAASVENLFRPPSMLALEEYGIPLPLLDKLADSINFDQPLEDVIKALRSMLEEKPVLHPFELEVLQFALV